MGRRVSGDRSPGKQGSGIAEPGTRTDRKRRPQTLQGSDKGESMTGTDIAQR